MLNFDRRYSLGFVQPRAEVGTCGWIVVLGACLVFIFNISLLPTFNIIFQPIFEISDNVSVTFATYVFQILTNLTVLVTGFLIKDLSAKHFVVIGSIMIFIGLVMTTFVTNLGELILTYSIFMSIGFGLLNPASFIAVLSCFNRSRNHAIGVCFSALGLGQMIMPIIAKYFLFSYDFRVTIAIMAGFSLIGLTGAYLLVPIKWRNSANQCPNNYQIDAEKQPLLAQKNEKQHQHMFVVREVVQASDLDLLADYKFIVISVGLSLIYALSSDFTKIFPDFLVDKSNFNFDEIKTCLLVINISDIIGRATFTFVTDVFQFSSHTVFIIGTIGIAFYRILVLHLPLTYELLFFLCILFGIFRALTVVNQVLIIADFCNKLCPKKLPGTLGLSFVIKSIFLTIFAYLFQKMGDEFSHHIYSHVILQSMIIILWCCTLSD